MNYLRGAVSAISAPYQYYKDLNPSTLTGAIDVIVVRRPKTHDADGSTPTTDDDSELVCSPFHVRFGKWQVLRPGDKKVNVFVNGQPIPFSMKIGEAGEAFFVFETDEDVPEALVTSPILAATQPGQSNTDVERAGRFGAKESPEAQMEQAMTTGATQEPDFLDLNAPSIEEPLGTGTQSPLSTSNGQDDDNGKPSLLARTAQLGKAAIGFAVETEKAERDKLKDKTVKEAIAEVEHDEAEFVKEKAASACNAAIHSTVSSLAGQGDEALPDADNVGGPEIVYTDDMVFDLEGYHAHERSRSEKTITRSHGDESSSTPGSSRTPSPSTSSSDRVPFPSFRATSEPPLEFAGDMTPGIPALTPPTTPPSRSPSISRMHATKARVGPHASIPTLRPPAGAQEYMWEWGNFPQKTPVTTMFAPFGDARSSQRKGKGRMRELEVDTNVEEDETSDGFVASPASFSGDADSEGSEGEETRYGAGGLLAVDRVDPTRFRVSIERKVVEFELSIVSNAGWTRIGGGRGPLGGEDEVVDADRFDKGKLDFQQFLNDEQVVRDEDLVLRWAGGMYITRKDGSPLMDALVLWRDAALHGQLAQSQSRSPSPGAQLKDIQEEASYSDEERRQLKRSSANLSGTTMFAPTNGDIAAPRPSSSSWVRWWSRSRRTENAQRPDLRAMNTAPSTMQRSRTEVLDTIPAPTKRSVSAAPTMPLSPELRSPTPDASSDEEKRGRKRFAKTLRLTSDQLKSLNLKSGANSITFSLSATGAVACTARLFVWDYTDRVVISDIDGTITKSDALGHVFTMIGRDWTHLGVAKLYTDICRNGYKIMYLTSRAIGQADSTRDYLKGVKQNDYQLPEGPVIMSPDRLMASLHREVIMRKPEVFKMAALRDIQKLFGNTAKNPFYAGFGNRITDALSYRSVNVPSSRIFTIDSTGEVKMELLELAGYKSSYIHMTDLVDQMFPPIHRKWAPEYTDFNYWKTPVRDFPLPDLFPPSPALSARSDTSNQSTLARLRHFSLGGSRQPSLKPFTLPPPATEGATKDALAEERRESHLRQMSSFERLSQTLVGLAQSASPLSSPRSSTPTFIDSGSEDEDEESDLEKQKKRRWKRRESMPGSLPGSDGSVSDDDIHFGMDDDGEDGYAYHGENEERAAEDAFDEDFLAAGEMQSVPFL
ncbi:uncharacterized protein FIBRA_02202 [Fibroporia radiculosa]|uniref:phosphatidate phosphatase n=1 Tax=Fibroporia radiculosa TaxID=599839 RepID=J4H1Q3_9APHY|nr:uncharacterized protein FIBRA_02202 [Fibroporia radiculosa]CCM00174.1 predicted protein [Fibroporia radiculosa]